MEIMDTTLRDGEQGFGITIMPREKLSLAKVLLNEVKVNRIEVGNARVSEGELDAVKQIMDWARANGYESKVEVLGFVDIDKSVDWLKKAGCEVMNLLCKGSLRHLTVQLRKTPEQHLEDIRKTMDYADQNGISVNVYVEDWSNGIIESPDYVYFLVENLLKLSVNRIMLPDTLGVFDTEQTRNYCKRMITKFPGARFDYHAHNDYGLATANTIEAVRAGIDCVHTTLNFLGERTGNAPLDEVAVALKDFLGEELSIDETKLSKASKLVELYSGRRVPVSKPVTGEHAFTQTAGIHADGDRKGNLYSSKLSPERFGRTRKYALGKLSGKASIEMNLRGLNIELNEEEKKKVLNRVVELGDKKRIVTTEDLPFIISDVLQSPDRKKIEVKSFNIVSNSSIKPTASVIVRYKDKEMESYATGNGGYDAFMNALKKMTFDFELPELVDYEVRIPPGGKTDAIVETTITWKNKREFRTLGVDTDQLKAAIIATEKMLNMMANNAVNKV